MSVVRIMVGEARFECICEAKIRKPQLVEYVPLAYLVIIAATAFVYIDYRIMTVCVLKYRNGFSQVPQLHHEFDEEKKNVALKTNPKTMRKK